MIRFCRVWRRRLVAFVDIITTVGPGMVLRRVSLPGESQLTQWQIFRQNEYPETMISVFRSVSASQAAWTKLGGYILEM